MTVVAPPSQLDTKQHYSLAPDELENKDELYRRWRSLEPIADAVILLQPIEKPVWVDAYSEIYRMCNANTPRESTWDPSEVLYSEVDDFIRRHVDNHYQFLVELPRQELLSAYYKRWTDYRTGIQYLSAFFMHLDKCFADKYSSHNRFGATGVLEQVYHFDISNSALNRYLKVRDIALLAWKEVLIDKCQKSLTDVLNEVLQQDRLNQNLESGTIVVNVINSFIEVDSESDKPLDIYRRTFLTEYLKQTAVHYEQLSSEMARSLPISALMEKVLSLLEDERLRCRKYLHETSFDEVMEVCTDKLVSQQSSLFVDEFVNLIQSENFTDLSNMYKILIPFPPLIKEFSTEFFRHVKKNANEAVKDLKPDQYNRFVDLIISIHKKYSGLISTCFNGAKDFVMAFDRACSAAINSKSPTGFSSSTTQSPAKGTASSASSTSDSGFSNVPFMLAKYADLLLKKQSTKGPGGTGHLSESEIEEKLTNSITIFKYIDDKDCYQKIYSNMLARRLIFRQSTSMEAEENAISKLKEVCGWEFTSKLQKMFTDMSLNTGLNTDFKKFCLDEIDQDKKKKKDSKSPSPTNGTITADTAAMDTSTTATSSEPVAVSTDVADGDTNKASSPPSITSPISQADFSILVLQSGAWPIDSKAGTALSLPEHLHQSIQMFERFYQKKFHGRKLTWLHNWSTGDLALNYLSKPYIAHCAILQLACLLHFNSTTELPFTDLAARVNILPSDLEPSVKGLIDARLLISNHETIDVTPKSRTLLKLNMNFSSKRLKFQIKSVAREKDLKHDVERSKRAVVEDRKMFVQATIVRILKSRKIIKHNQLAEEIIKQSHSRFLPDMTIIKKQIEVLIEKEYIARSSDKPDQYEYLA